MNNNDIKETIRELGNDNLSNSPTGTSVMAKDIIGCIIWNESEPECHRVFGMFISNLVKEGALPLAFDGINSSRHNCYRVL